MILMGAGTNHWFHSDQIYRAMLVLTTITGCQGRNGGGWAHYVGQEKIRPIMGFQHMAFALDWHRPPRHMNQTAYWYVNTSQYRYDTFTADDLDAGTGVFAGQGRHGPARPVGAAGLDPELPDVRPQQPRPRRRRGGRRDGGPGATSSTQLKAGTLKFAVEDPEAEDNHPRVLSACGAPTCSAPAPRATSTSCEHLLGTDSAATAVQAPPDKRPEGRRVARRGGRGQASTCS